MRTTVDIPNELYRKLKAKAALEGSTVRDVIVRLVKSEVQPEQQGHREEETRSVFPVIRGKEKRTLNLTNEEIDEILFS